ncbi:hypothetical protein LZ31DRAFT_245503 [Colletotrichum somersetense]|nr:hypothetical protein LZ31DRAFT_245503 [Colletotrichum somersetense]
MGWSRRPVLAFSGCQHVIDQQATSGMFRSAQRFRLCRIPTITAGWAVHRKSSIVVRFFPPSKAKPRIKATKAIRLPQRAPQSFVRTDRLQLNLSASSRTWALLAGWLATCACAPTEFRLQRRIWRRTRIFVVIHAQFSAIRSPSSQQAPGTEAYHPTKGYRARRASIKNLSSVLSNVDST